LQAKAGYDYSQNKDDYNSEYRQRSTESSGQTERDDYLKGDLQLIDVWRYRVYGIKPGNKLNAFYEIVMPGERVPFSGAGQNFYWYQPRHENGNILTYPATLGRSRFIPDDLGSYRLPNGAVQNKPQVPASLNYFDGNGTTSTLRWSEEIANGTSFTYSHQVAESLDIKASFKGKATVRGGFYNETSLCGSFEVHNSNSWGETSTSDETTTGETAIILNKAAGIPKNSYPFYPVIYNTLDGTMKVNFAVPNPSDPLSNFSGHQTFAEIYGGRPDPALNLPGRFQPIASGTGELEQWTPNTSIGRKVMRGLFFRHSDVDPASGSHLLYAFSPTDGDKVRIEARVYNLSTAQPALNTTVEFQVIPYESLLNREVCDSPINKRPGVETGWVCPRSARRTIGTVTIPRLNPLQFTCVSGFDNPASTGCYNDPVYIDWNTTGFAPLVGSNEYRVYVVLNPGNSGAPEVYPIEPDAVQITQVENNTPFVVTAPGHPLETGDYVTIGGVEGLRAANGTFRVTRLSADQFSLDGTSNTSGSYTGGGLASELDPGQNNEGYGMIAVTSPAALTVTSGEGAPQDYLEADALEVLNPAGEAQLHANQLSTTRNTPLELRFTAHSSRVHTDPAHVLFYDGDPASGAPAIADRLIYPGLHGSDGASIWFDWTPPTAGQHHLVAVLFEGSATAQLASELNINVTPK
jgi:hypothetical protein